jgi:hypothetical protein
VRAPAVAAAALVAQALLAWAMAGLVACSPRNRPPAPDHDADAPITDGDGDIDADGDVDADADGRDEPICDTQPIEITTEPPRVMILLDQSSSMIESSWGSHSHWTSVQDGLRALFEDARHRRTYFGLDPFPDGTAEYLERCDDECCREPACMMADQERCDALRATCERSCAVDLPPWVTLAPAETSGPLILDYVNQPVVPTAFGKTPIVEQLRWYARDNSALLPELYRRDGTAYLMLLSDGEDTCEVADGGAPATVSEIAAALREVTAELLATWGIRTFAIGFGDTEGDMSRELDAIAGAGGTAFDDFFPITSDVALVEAFDAISTSIVSCTYRVEEPGESADPTAVNFYLDGAVVGYDEACEAGWRWVDQASLQIEFCGAACDRLTSGEAERIEARFGCETVVW